MFIGTNIVRPDAKGRIAVPARHRERLRDCCASRVAVTVHPKGKPCLWMYPWNEWETVAATVAGLPPLVDQNARLQHLLLSNAFELELDSQGRVLLPPYLRFIEGVVDSEEIWEAEAWSAVNTGYLAAVNEPGSELSADLQNLLL